MIIINFIGLNDKKIITLFREPISVEAEVTT